MLNEASVEVSTTLMFYLVVVCPALSFAVNRLIQGGKKTKASSALAHVMIILGLSVITSFQITHKYRRPNAYNVLNVDRHQNPRDWARAYAVHRDKYKRGEISAELFNGIDQAYESLYNENQRVLYDTWGADAAVDTVSNSAEKSTVYFINTSFFYFVWIWGTLCLCSKHRVKPARNWAFPGLLTIFCFEFFIKFEYWNPIIPGFSRMTPNELLRSLYKIYPAYVLFCTSYKSLFFMNSKFHRLKVLKRAERDTKFVKKMLHDIRDSIKNIKAD